MEHRLADYTDAQLRNIQSLDFCRWISALYHGDNSVSDAAAHFAMTNPRSMHRHVIDKVATEMLTKANVDPGTSYTPGWASPLASLNPLSGPFVAVARPASLLGKFGDLVNKVPFNVSVPAQSSGSSYAWVGQGAPKPVGNLALQSVTLPIAKASGLIIVTEELIRLTQPASVIALRRELIRGLSQFLDTQLVDHTVAAVTNVSPASITNGAPTIASAGTSAANAATDLKKLLSTFTTTNPNTESIALLMSPGTAVAIAVATNTTSLGVGGGEIYGCPVFTSTAVGGRIVALDATALLVGDDDGIAVSVSRNATVELDTSGTSPVTAGTVIVSLWQSNLVGIKVDRFINWKMARPNAVLYSNVVYV